jgi:hypothetical protein
LPRNEKTLVEPRKYSTGTKGRLKMHSDQCREFIHANSPDFHLATEFIQTLDPDREDRNWQKFQSPEDTLPFLQAWLAGDEMPSERKAPEPRLVTAKNLKPPQNLDAALKITREWVEENRSRLATLPAMDAVEEVLNRLSTP